MTEIVWRQWYTEEAVKNLTDMKALPREKIEVNTSWCYDGSDVAAEIARLVNFVDNEWFRISGDKLIILEPEEFAGTYEIEVEYEPSFIAIPVD